MATRSIRILIAEDEMLIRELAIEDLSEAGFDVVAAASGNEALAVLDGDPDFQVLFTDIRMPGQIDGTELARRAKAMIPGLRVIYATGYDDMLFDLEPTESCISKPYTSDHVLERLRSLGVV